MCRAAVVTPSRSVASASPKQRLGKGTSLLVPYQRPIGNAASAAEVRRCFITVEVVEKSRTGRTRHDSRNQKRQTSTVESHTLKDKDGPPDCS
jgi:hypothetical protein